MAILDADKEGFLRSVRSLVQTCGRASRNVGGMVIMYADHVTKSMKQAIDETNRRREIQQDYNKKYNITPTTIKKNIASIFETVYETDHEQVVDNVSETHAEYESADNLDDIIKAMEDEMNQAARELAFEKAAELRDQIKALKKTA